MNPTTTKDTHRRRHGRILAAATGLALAAAVVPATASAGIIGWNHIDDPGHHTEYVFADQGADTRNTLKISRPPGSWTTTFTDYSEPLSIASLGYSNPCHQVDAHTVACEGPDVTYVSASLGGGDDHVEMFGAMRLNVDAGGGDDVVFGGTEPDDLHGGWGDDKLYGNAGIDYLWGEGDDDELHGGEHEDDLSGGPGRDLLDGARGDDKLAGGQGRDTADYRDRTADVSIAPVGDGAIVHATVAQLEQDSIQLDVENFQGGSGDDFIRGTAADNALYGHGGIDHLTAGAGTDFVDGGPGDDLLFGGPGNDTLAGRAGSDELGGGDGRDILEGQAGPDKMLGGNQDDWIYARDGEQDFVQCSAGFGDWLQADALDTSLLGCETVEVS